VERYIVFKTSGSIKQRTQTSSEMGISCQRNGHWAATSHLSDRGLLQPIKELSSAAGRCVGRGCALIRQLANAFDWKANCYSSGPSVWWTAPEREWDWKTLTTAKLDGCRVSSITTIDNHVTASWCLVPVSARRVSLGYQLRQSQLTHVDGRRFRFESD